MATVFLSYARDDAARVRLLANLIERAGHDVWWDDRISGGAEFSGAIEEALESADVVVVAWTAGSVRSHWVRDEAATGRDSGRLVPVTLDGSLPPLGFRQLQTIDLAGRKCRGGTTEAKKLIAAIEERSSARDPDAPLSKAAPVAAMSGGRRHMWVAAGAALLLLFVAGLLYPRFSAWAGPEPVEAKVRLGEFQVISADLPKELPAVLGEEIVAAFGAENAVAVIEDDGGDGSSSAPFLLDGGIRQIRDSVRYTVSLKNSENGAVLWSQAYDRPAGESLAPRQVAVASSQVVRCGLWGASAYHRRMSDRALTLYMQFCDEHWSGSTDPWNEVDAARRVTVEVPDFSFGWSALALAAVPLANRAGSAEADELRKEAIAAAERSMELDPLNPEGYMAKAGLIPLDRFAEREALLKKAISVRPTECGCERQAYGDFLSSVGRMEEAVVQYERAQAMRPLAPFTNLRLVHALYVVGRYDEAERMLAQTLAIWPDADSLRLLDVKSAFWTGEHDEALSLLRSAPLHLTDPQRDALTASFEALDSGDAGLRTAAVDQLREFAADPRKNDRLVVAALAALGNGPAALDAARGLVQSGGNLNAAVLFEPNLRAASRSPQFAQLVGQLGLTRYWHETKAMPDLCRDQARPAFCATG